MDPDPYKGVPAWIDLLAILALITVPLALVILLLHILA
jgi:hypothetical protein